MASFVVVMSYRNQCTFVFGFALQNLRLQCELPFSESNTRSVFCNRMFSPLPIRLSKFAF